ncbi:MAG TPA: hypothetical protein PK303_03765 [bacterium]|nr:hypothetical protein [bacterium]
MIKKIQAILLNIIARHREMMPEKIKRIDRYSNGIGNSFCIRIPNAKGNRKMQDLGILTGITC